MPGKYDIFDTKGGNKTLKSESLLIIILLITGVYSMLHVIKINYIVLRY
jgi:hypothetical protein